MPLPHLCFPPQYYPEGYGPGSRWQCRRERRSGAVCDKVWEADGVLVDQYPVSLARNDKFLRPVRWLLVEGLAEDVVPWEADLYDAREAVSVMVEAARRLWPDHLNDL